MDAEPPTLRDLATAFFRIGLTGVGGVGPVARHMIVEQRQWLDDRGYSRLIGLCQALPGANTINCAVILGDRYQGPCGALVCLVSLMAAPLLLLVGLLVLYSHIAAAPVVQSVLVGAAASAAGLIIGTAAKMLQRSRPGVVQVAIALLAFGLVAGLGLSVPGTLLLVGPISLVIMAYTAKRSS